MEEEKRLDENTIRENLKKKRVERGYTQADVADSLDISVTAYQKIESGRTRILNRNYSRCAETLGVSLSELINGFEPLKDAVKAMEEAKIAYGLKMKVQESGYLNEIQSRDREIERLKGIIKDKEDTISTQKLLIDQLMGRLKV